MIYNFLCLIILALVAHQTKKVFISALVFALLKGVGYLFLNFFGEELGTSIESISVSSITIFIVNGILGYGIATIIAKHPKDKQLMVANMALALTTFIVVDLARTLVP